MEKKEKIILIAQFIIILLVLSFFLFRLSSFFFDKNLETKIGDESPIEYGPYDRIDINKAGTEEITKVPGIGEVIAERIVEYRKKKGKLRNLDELLEIDGIGKKKLDEMKGYVIIR